MIDRGVVSSILGVITFFGILANSIALYYVYRHKHLHNTFGVLCAVIAVANLGDSLINLIWSAYGPYLFEEAIITGIPGKAVGLVALFILDLKVYAHFGVSINRLFSIMFPLKYHFEKSRLVTAAFVLFPIFAALAQVSPLFWTDYCYFIYFEDAAVWGYEETACNDFYSFYIDFILPVFIFCCIITLDAIAVFSLRRALDMSGWNDNLIMKRRMEIGFFVQSLCQMSISIAAYFSFFVLSRFATTEWMLFSTTTLPWVVLHTIDGIIMDIFQARKVMIRMQTAFPEGSTVAPSGISAGWTSTALNTP